MTDIECVRRRSTGSAIGGLVPGDDHARSVRRSTMRSAAAICWSVGHWPARNIEHCESNLAARGRSMAENETMLLKWPDILNLAKNGNPAPDRGSSKRMPSGASD
jgi:hypothetical protein